MDKIVSIIIPIKPENVNPKVLESLNVLDYPKDKTEILIERGYNPSVQRNKAIKRAKGDIILFIDDDVDVQSNLIKEHLKCYTTDKIVAVGGPGITPTNIPKLQLCFGYVFSSYFGSGPKRARYTQIGKIRKTGEGELILCNLSMRKDVLSKELFNENLFYGEENELLTILEKKSFEFVYNPNAIVYHYPKQTIPTFCRQVFSYGKNRLQCHVPLSMLSLMPTIFLFYLIALSILLLFGLIRSYYFIPLITYFIFNLLFSLEIAIKNKIWLVSFLPPLFLLFHLNYGASIIYSFMKIAKQTTAFFQKKTTPRVHPD